MGVLTDWAVALWPWVVAVALALGIAVGVLCVLIARRRAWVVRRARWVEISSPAEVFAGGGLALWSQAAPRLTCQRFGLLRRVLSWELYASPEGIRAGLWVPGDISAEVVSSAVQSAWPGAQARVGSPRELPGPDRSGPVTGARLRPTAESWLPICAVEREPKHRPQPQTAEVLRVVFASLAACRSGKARVGVQVLVRRASRWRMRRMRGGARELKGTGTGTGPGILRGMALELLDIATPGPATRARQSQAMRSPPLRTPAQAEEPLVTPKWRALVAKASAGPHFEVSVRLVAFGGTRTERRELVNSVASGFGMVTMDAPVPVELASRPFMRPVRVWHQRHARHWHWFVASLPEVAALAHLPVEPARYGLPTASARRFPPPPEALSGEEGE